MARFVDAKGDEWKLTLDLGLIQEVKDEVGVNLAATNRDEKWQAALADQLILGAIFYVVCQDQIKERNLTPREFARRFTGDTLRQAHGELMVAIMSFGQSSRIEEEFREQQAKMAQKTENELIKQMPALLMKAETRMQQVIQEVVTKPFPDLKSGTNSPGFAG